MVYAFKVKDIEIRNNDIMIENINELKKHIKTITVKFYYDDKGNKEPTEKAVMAFLALYDLDCKPAWYNSIEAAVDDIGFTDIQFNHIIYADNGLWVV